MPIIIGVIAGMVTAIGMGGGTVLILLLTLLLNLPQHSAQAINLIFYVPTAITSIIINLKNKSIDFKLGFSIIIWGVLGSIIGAIFSSRVNINLLRKCFGIFLLFIAIYEIYNYYNEYIKNKNTHTKFDNHIKVKDI